jgi:methyl-accepting chemotaxis protein
MEILSNISLKSKLIILLILPILGIIYFSQNEVRNAISIKNESHAIVRLASFSVIASSLVHELQKERGASAGYIGSQGSKFVKKLPEQYKLTDAKIVSLKNYLQQFDSKQFGDKFDKMLNKAVFDLDKITKKRSAIKNLNLGIKQVLKYYTGLNKQFLNFASEMSTLSANGEIATLTSSYANFLQSKERAGIERAVLANTFSADAFGNGMYDKFISLIAIQSTYLNVFTSLAPQNQKDFFQKIMRGESITATKKMRAIAQKNSSSGGFGVDSGYWFKMQTEKINLLKKVEDKLSGDLIEKTNLVANTANNSLLLSVAFSAIILLLTLFLALFFIRTILIQLGCDPMHLHEVVEAIAKGNLKMDLSTGGKKATGVYASAQVMQKNLREQIERDRKAAAETGRIKQALDNVTSNVMLADPDLNIIYMNDASIAMFENAEADICKQLPDFDSTRLIGTNIDDFHKNPAHQRELLGSLSSTFRSSLTIGGRYFNIVANPVISADGEHIGTVVEWLDRTGEVHIEQEIEAIVDSVKSGELSNRLDLTDKEGFFEKLSTGINELTDIIEKVFSDISNSMQSIAKGDLSNKITNDYQGVYLECKNNINASIDQLAKIVTDVNESAEFINNSSQEIASGNNNLSQRAEQQAANLEETASSMEELTSTVKNNADNAQKANQVANAARELAEQGGHVVNSAIDAMQEINESSNKIADIIGVIDEIAFQTNLLALNASVEAARAGEQGRGFSVVATEVRNLAQRSARAAKESKLLIQTSVQKVSSGSKFVNQTGKSLTEIVSSVQKVNDIVAKIATASSEQSQGIEQVNQAVSQMDEITQQNAALAEQASAASVSMSDEAGKMTTLLSFFKLKKIS